MIPLKFLVAPAFLTLEISINKLQFRYVECTFIGYSLDHKGYKFLDLHGEVIISRNFILNEHSFPFARNSISANLPTSVPQNWSSPQAHILIITSKSTDLPVQTQPDNNFPESTNANPPPTSNFNSPSLIDQPVEKSNLPNNIHGMQTKSISRITRLQRLLQQMNHPQFKKLYNMNIGKLLRGWMLGLQRSGSWSLVPQPRNKRPRGCKWVFKVKGNLDGTVHKYKARLVAKDFHQVAGFEFTETFSLMVKPTTIRIILTIALLNGWTVRQLD